MSCWLLMSNLSSAILFICVCYFCLLPSILSLFCFVPGFHNFTFISESSNFMPKNMHKTRNTIEFRFFIKRMHQQQLLLYRCTVSYTVCVRFMYVVRCTWPVSSHNEYSIHATGHCWVIERQITKEHRKCVLKLNSFRMPNCKHMLASAYMHDYSFEEMVWYVAYYTHGTNRFAWSDGGDAAIYIALALQ